MRFHGLDLNLLVALDALLTHQNVTRAAEQLNLSQSALSGALARLREHFDDELVVSIGRRMEAPSPSGGNHQAGDCHVIADAILQDLADAGGQDGWPKVTGHVVRDEIELHSWMERDEPRRLPTPKVICSF